MPKRGTIPVARACRAAMAKFLFSDRTFLIFLLQNP
jgi:hypothetical protein